jgi:CheY-like chemotaxis protein
MMPELKKILVVDDESSMRHMLQLVLEKEGYQVTETAEGGVALELLREEVPESVAKILGELERRGYTG